MQSDGSISINTQNICAVKEMRTSPTGAQSLLPPLTKDFIIERYADLFDGVGLLDGEVHLEVDRTVPPIRDATSTEQSVEAKCLSNANN